MILQNFIFRRTVTSAVLSLGLAVTSLATAQTAAPAASDKARVAPVWKQEANHGSWEVICAKSEKVVVIDVSLDDLGKAFTAL